VVAREFTSKPSSRIEALRELRKALKNLKKVAPSELHKNIAGFETSVEAEFDRHEKIAKQRFSELQSAEHAREALLRHTQEHGC
jgi:hypothetical protein